MYPFLVNIVVFLGNFMMVSVKSPFHEIQTCLSSDPWKIAGTNNVIKRLAFIDKANITSPCFVCLRSDWGWI